MVCPPFMSSGIDWLFCCSLYFSISKIGWFSTEIKGSLRILFDCPRCSILPVIAIITETVTLIFWHKGRNVCDYSNYYVVKNIYSVLIGVTGDLIKALQADVLSEYGLPPYLVVKIFTHDFIHITPGAGFDHSFQV